VHLVCTAPLDVSSCLQFLGLVGLQSAGLNPIGNIFRTPGVENIENRYSAGGGAKTHLPGSATPLGRSDLVTGNTEHQQGIGTEKFAKSQGDQKPAVSPRTKNALAMGSELTMSFFDCDLAHVVTNALTSFIAAEFI